MSDRTLQQVLAILRERLPGKLSAASVNLQNSSTPASATPVDVYRGATFQFAWYLKKLSKRHAILLKDRQLIFESGQLGSKEPISQDATTDAIADETEETVDQKPLKRTNYTGFSIYGHQLVIIVEPWPPIPKKASNRADFVLGLNEPKEQSELVRDHNEDDDEDDSTPSNAPRQSTSAALSVEEFLKANAAQKRTGAPLHRKKARTGNEQTHADKADEQDYRDDVEENEALDPVQGILSDELGLGNFEDQSTSNG